MRIGFLIVLMITFTSCGKNPARIVDTKFSNGLESDYALTIPHENRESLIRSKLLNKLVENTFPRESANPKAVIRVQDELHHVELSADTLASYEAREKLFTKIVVSFSDREEVYFIKEKIASQNFIKTLNLQSEEGRVLKLIPSPYYQSYNGATFYIVSVNHEDLMKNDQQFYSVESRVENFQEMFHVGKFKAAVVQVNYELYAQALRLVRNNPPGKNCRQESFEADTCPSKCEYSYNVAGDFEKVLNPKIADLGLNIKFDSFSYNVHQLSAINSKEGYFEIKFDSADLLESESTFQVQKTPSASYSGSTAHSNFSSDCNSNDRARSTNYTLNSKATMDIKVVKLGRGEELLKINL